MRIQHPLTRLYYERMENGCICVCDKSGTCGIFDKEGKWISGERKTADPLMCVWVATRPAQSQPAPSQQQGRDAHERG